MRRTLFIDAANLRSGGAITHIIEMLNSVPDDQFFFNQVIIVGRESTLDKIYDRPWIKKITHKWLNKGLLYILLWKLIYLKSYLAQNNVLFFSPAGTYTGSYRPYSAMSRNMLIFDSKESQRYSWSWMRLKFWLLRRIQVRSFENAGMIIFISEYAKNAIASFLRKEIRDMPVIYHGISKRFEQYPRSQQSMSDYDFDRPFKLLYVSPITVYKHQWVLIRAVAKLRNNGYPLQLDLAGGGYRTSLKKFYKELFKIANHDQFIHYHGKVPHESIHDLYKNADGFVYGSTCENMPNILIEAMSSGLPIACSNYQPMPEFLGESEFYFDPTNELDVYKTLKFYLDNPGKRLEHALRSYHNSLKYSWKKCAKETFDALAHIAN